jgi:phosphoribosylformylglycinamidine cyclo-ligase
MPDFYAPGEYDLAGTIIGVVDRQNIIDGSTIQESDSIIALPSSGLHTNGYSLVRKLFLDSGRYQVEQHIDMLGASLVDELLMPHKCYAKPVGKLLDTLAVRGMAHITGGGLTDNIPRVLPKTLDAEINRASWRPPAMFELIRRDGDIAQDEMFKTFNMGVGMILVVSPADEPAVLKSLKDDGEDAWTVGRIVRGNGNVKYTG